MFGRIVSVDGRQIFVCCTPRTPYSEICYRAAQQLAKDEETEAARDPVTIMYRDALARSNREAPHE